jgi:hypothetical protein
MKTVDVKLPSDLVEAADLENTNVSQEAARLLALELYREDKVSLGRAPSFARLRLHRSWTLLPSMAFLPCDTALRNWRKNADQLMSLACDRRCRFIAPDYSGEA